MDCPMAYLFGISTTGKEEDAVRLAKTLVSEHLVACANVLSPVRSFYQWKGDLCEEAEWILFMKTTSEKLDGIKFFLQQHHPYDEPELIFLPIEDGSPTYLKWIRDSLDAHGSMRMLKK
jgi:periplasmic divalent cation tolerance protein